MMQLLQRTVLQVAEVQGAEEVDAIEKTRFGEERRADLKRKAVSSRYLACLLCYINSMDTIARFEPGMPELPTVRCNLRYIPASVYTKHAQCM